MNQPTNHITRIRKYLVWLFWIAVWQTANLLIHNNIIFVGPLDMIKALAEQAADPSRAQAVLEMLAEYVHRFPEANQRETLLAVARTELSGGLRTATRKLRWKRK